MDLAFREFVGDNICAIDLTPMPGIDDLLQPTESIKEAQQLAAEAWGADNTFFLINGSTSGNQCMMMAAVNAGDKIAVPRNSHKSMLGGLVMSGAEPVYMRPEVDAELRMDHCVTPETVAATLREHPEVVAVYLVSPTYYGVAADLAGDRAHRARCGQAAARGRGLGTALPFSRRAADLRDGGRQRSLHQLDAQDALGVLAVRDAAPEGFARAPRSAQGRAQDVPLDVAEPPDGRVVGRRAQADGDGGRRAALAHHRARAGDARPPQRDPRHLLLRRRVAGPRGHIRPRPDEDHRDHQGPRLHRIRGVGDTAAALQHPGRAGRSLQRRRALHDRHDARRGRAVRRGVRGAGARQARPSTCSRRREFSSYA